MIAGAVEEIGQGAGREGGEWTIRGCTLALDRPRIMGILNVTPDSFSDGGAFEAPRAALERAQEMVEEGADLIDVGGESTRPGAAPVEPAVQIRRVVPVVRLLTRHLSVPLSVDTRSAEVARAAIEAGAAIVNDVAALAEPAMADVVREGGVGVVLMHMRGTPRTMQDETLYADLLGEIRAELGAALNRARAAGVPDAAIVLDPGIGFAKTSAHSLELIARIGEILPLGRPLLVGPSRKRFLGEILGGAPPRQRAVGTAAACVAALFGGARLFRVHDVAPVRHALDVAEAIRRAGLHAL
ncbi:dihydropteroate synthase [soil metagenome]